MNRRTTFAFGAAVAVLLFALMGLTIAKVEPWGTEASDEDVAAANDQATVVDTLFGPQAIALEVLGVLLTAAMIGALVIARPLEAADDETHYSHPTKAQVAESDKASDPATHAASLLASQGAGK